MDTVEITHDFYRIQHSLLYSIIGCYCYLINDLIYILFRDEIILQTIHQ